MRFTDERWRPRHIQMVPTKEKLTDSTGLGTLVEIFDKSPFANEFSRCLPQRVHARSHGSYRLGLTLVSGFIYGHDSLDDLKEFQTDPALEANMKGETVAPRTMGDFLRDFEDEHLERLNKYLAKMARGIRRHMQEVIEEKHRPKKAVHISIDSTPHEQEGTKMEGVAWNYKDQWCLDSQVTFDEIGLCYGFQLRPGNTYSSENAEELIDQAFDGEKFHDEKYLSADSAYCDQGVIRRCLSQGIRFTITAHDQRTSWRERIGEIDDWEPWKYPEEEIQWYEKRKLNPPQRELGRIFWRPSWAENIVLPIIVKKEWKTEQEKTLFDQESGGGHWHYYAVVTNDSLYKRTKQQIIERHNKRGNAENFIREEKYGYDLKHFPCLKLKANYAFGLLAMVAHNLLRWVAVVEKPDKPHFSKKLRRRHIFIPGKVVQHARKIIMRVPVHFFKEVNRLREAWQLPLHPAPAWAYG